MMKTRSAHAAKIPRGYVLREVRLDTTGLCAPCH
jgi:hypothetical protein